MRNFSSGSLLLLISLLVACSEGGPPRDSAAVAPEPTPILDIHSIAGKTPAEVETVLGSPSTRTTAKHEGRELPNYLYRGDSIDIRYVNGRAEWIDISGLQQLTFGPDVIRAFGIHDAPPPTQHTEHVIQWLDYTVPGFRNVYIFPAAPSGVHYIYFQVSREP